MFGGESAWTVTGQRDLGNMNAKIKKHASSTQHLNRVIDLSLLGTSNIANAIDSGHALYIARHNAEVKKNRDPYQKLLTALNCAANVNHLLEVMMKLQILIIQECFDLF